MRVREHLLRAGEGPTSSELLTPSPLPGPLPEPLCTRFMDFVCKNRQQCLFHSMVCDGIVQCRDGSDEDATFAGCCEWAGWGGARATGDTLGGAGHSGLQVLLECPILPFLGKTYLCGFRSVASWLLVYV